MIGPIIQLIEVWGADGAPILDLCVKKYLTENELYMADAFKALVGDGKAKVRREVTETLGGPRYSSVKVSTSIEITCDQSKEKIGVAARELYAEAQILNDEAMELAWKQLSEHIEKTDWT